MEFNTVKSMNTPSTFTLEDKQLLYDEFTKLSIFSRIGIMLGRQVFVMRLKGLKFYAWRCKDCGNVGISYVHGYDRYLQCELCMENADQLARASSVEGVIYSIDTSIVLMGDLTKPKKASINLAGS